jgi:hypothetical protein
VAPPEMTRTEDRPSIASVPNTHSRSASTDEAATPKMEPYRSQANRREEPLQDLITHGPGSFGDMSSMSRKPGTTITWEKQLPITPPPTDEPETLFLHPTSDADLIAAHKHTVSDASSIPLTPLTPRFGGSEDPTIEVPKVEVSIARSVSLSRGQRQKLIPLGAALRRQQSGERLVDKGSVVATIIP